MRKNEKNVEEAEENKAKIDTFVCNELLCQ